MSIKLTSPAFENQQAIPERYSKGGGNISPPLAWTNVPETAKNLALIVDDPDAPKGVFVHWLVYGIRPSAKSLDEDLPASETLIGGARQGRNGFGDLGYGGPQPPSGTHHYIFHLYALDTELDLPPGADRQKLDQAMRGHILEEAQLTGTYQHRAPGSRAA